MSLRQLVLQTRRHSSVFVLCGILLLPAVAQQLSPLPIEDVLSARSFVQNSPVEFSPDNERLAYVVAQDRPSKLAKMEDFLRAGFPISARSTDILVVELKTGESRSITRGVGENWLPVWSPDGKYLAMLSDRDGSGLAKLWVWEVATAALRKVSDVNVRTNQLQWLPNSRAVLASVLPAHMTAAEFAAKLINPKKDYGGEISETTNASVEVYRSAPQGGDRKPVLESPPWSLDYALCDLGLIDIATGNVKRIDQQHRISAYFLSPDGSQVAYTSPQSFQKPGSQQILFDIALITLQTGQLRTIVSHAPLEFGGASVNWSPDGSMLAYRTGGMEANGDCFVVNQGSGLVRNVTGFSGNHAGYSYLPPIWDAQGRRVFLTDGTVLWAAAPTSTRATKVVQIPGHSLMQVMQNGKGTLWSVDNSRATILPAFDRSSKRFTFYRVGLGSSDITPVLTIDQTPVSIALDLFGTVSNDGTRFAYFSQDARHDLDLWLTNSDFAGPKRLTYLNPEFEHYQMGVARLIDWMSLDGDPLRGTLLLPSGYQSGQRYPLIVWVYGGSQGSDSLNQFGIVTGTFNLQLLATRGYAVLFPDAPQHLGTPMADLAKTVLPGINKVIEMGVADGSRVGVIGHSYGGYSVLSLLVQAQRFKAAVMVDGGGDLISSYGQMDSDGTAFGIAGAEGGQELMGGTPWEFRDRYIENSPVFYFDRIATPLLIIHGTDDFTVAPFLGDEVFVDLRRLGKRVDYAKYLGEGHVPSDWSRADRSDFWNRVLSWFQTYLLENPGTRKDE